MKNERVREAFGIKQGYAEGSSFSAEYQDSKRESEKAEKEAKQKEYEKSIRRSELFIVDVLEKDFSTC